MATESTTKVGELIEQARSMFAVSPMIEPQMEQFWKAQDGILDEIETYSQAWLERRHEATKTALEAVRKANGKAADPAVAMRTISDWQQGSFQRLADDMQQWFELCSRCARRMTEAEVEASKEGVEDVTKRTKSAARTKQSSPV